MLWFQTRHSKSSFLFPFLSRVWVLSRHITGSAWFVFHWRAFSKVQTVIYLVSPIPLVHLASYPHMWNISSVTGVLRQSPLSRSPPGARWDEGGKTKRIQLTVSALFGHFNADLTSENRGTNDFSGSSESWLVDIFFLLYLLYLTHSQHLAFVYSVQ